MTHSCSKQLNWRQIAPGLEAWNLHQQWWDSGVPCRHWFLPFHLDQVLPVVVPIGIYCIFTVSCGDPNNFFISYFASLLRTFMSHHRGNKPPTEPKKNYALALLQSFKNLGFKNLSHAVCFFTVITLLPFFLILIQNSCGSRIIYPTGSCLVGTTNPARTSQQQTKFFVIAHVHFVLLPCWGFPSVPWPPCFSLNPKLTNGPEVT